MRSYFYLVLIILAGLFFISSVSAGEIQLLCLDKGQALKFSQCNPTIRDRTCNSDLGCQYCVTYDARRGVYCPSNINVCNIQQDLSCSNLIENNPPQGSNLTGSQNQTSGSGSNQSSTNSSSNNSRTVRADIAYILKDELGVDDYLLNELRADGYSYEIIYERDVSKTDFNNYYIMLIGNQRLDDPSKIPADEHKTLVMNSYNYYKRDSDWQLGWSRISGSVSSPSILNIQDNRHPIINGLPSRFNAYNIRDASVKTSFLNGQKPVGIDIAVSSGGVSDAVIATVSPGTIYLNGKAARERALFFGVIKTRYWTSQTKQLFSNSLKWLIEGADVDGDGFLSDVDCNDRNPNINPASSDPALDCNNDPPLISDIGRVFFHKGDKAVIRVQASDPENDHLIYSINDPRFTFSPQDKTFWWQTAQRDGGEYHIRVEVNDGEFKASDEFILEIGNNPPEFSNVPDINWEEDSSAVIDLNKYASDKDDDSLTFGVEDSSDNPNIQLSVVSPGVFRLTSSSDWFGEDWIIFKVFDGRDSTASNRVNLKVSPINDAPRFAGQIENISWNEDDSLYKSLNLNDYFIDIDSELLYSVEGNRNIQITIEDGKVSFSQPADWSGEETVVFKARDGTFRLESNKVLLSVQEKEEPPEFSDLNCEKEIQEDQTYSCDLDAFDFEDDPLIFSTGRESHLNCRIIDNKVLEYVSEEDYTGTASCRIIVSDKDGSDVENLEVNILPVNDAPKIESASPDSSYLKIPASQNKIFEIDAHDPENDDFSINWLLDNVQVARGASYTFNKPNGVYNLQAVISDSKLENSRFWSILVGDSQEFTCSEVSGRICNENQICNGTIISTKDSPNCCSVQCSPKPKLLRDLKTCEQISNDVNIDILSPNGGDKLKAGDTINVEITLENKFNKNQDFNVDVSLYDKDDDKEINNERISARVDRNRKETFNVPLEIPEDADLKNDYLIFVKAKDNICNQESLDINIERPKNMLAISSFDFVEKLNCGDTLNVKTGVQNLGTGKQDLYLSLENKALNINKKSEKISLEEFDKDDRSSQELIAAIPSNAKPGEYPLILTARGISTASQTKNLLVECSNTNSSSGKETSSQQDESGSVIELGKKEIEGVSEESTQKSSSWIVLSVMLLFTFVAVAFLFLCWNIYGKK